MCQGMVGDTCLAAMPLKIFSPGSPGQDALREFFELEATYLEAAAAGGALSGHDFGACCPFPVSSRFM